MKNGKVSQAVLDRSVLRPLKRCSAAGPEEIFGADGAFITTAGCRTMITTSTDVVKGLYDRSPAMVAAGCLNSLACAGAKAESAVLDVMFPADWDEKILADIVRETGEMLQANGVQVVSGHTAVSSAVKRPVLTVTVTGETAETSSEKHDPTGKNEGAGASHKSCRKVKAGDAIIMTGYAGLGGTALLANAGREDLLKRFPHTLVSDAQAFEKEILVIGDVEAARGYGHAAMKDISEGGVYASLWEIAEREQIGFTVNLRSIPLRQETVEICEFYDLNPYQLLGTGGTIVISPRGEEICSALAAMGRSASVIGYVTEGKGREIVNGEEIRYLEKPQQDMLRVIADRT